MVPTKISLCLTFYRMHLAFNWLIATSYSLRIWTYISFFSDFTLDILYLTWVRYDS